VIIKAPPHSADLLRITVFSGFMFMLLLVGAFTGVYIATGGVIPDRMKIEPVSAFHRLLKDYDFKYRRITESDSYAVQRQELENLDSDLDRLEKKAEGVESWLSILKRRRQLANRDPRYVQSYLLSSQRASKAFPHSEPIAAVAAGAIVYNTAITKEGETQLRNILPLLADARFASMRLSLHVLMGDFHKPETAAEKVLVVTGSPLDAGMFVYFANPEARVIITNMAILRIITGDVPGAIAGIQSALSAFPSPELTRLAAEYYYDFGSLLRSAELFSTLPDESALNRQADALWLAGYASNARTIWAAMLGESRDAVHNKILYNLAVTTNNQELSEALLDRLIQQTDGEDHCRQLGLVLFSRFYEASDAVALLDTERLPPPQSAYIIPHSSLSLEALIDLEILKRRTEIGEISRMIAETWLLLDRHPHTEYLHQWAAWYFELQRQYTEIAALRKFALRNNFSGQWMDIHEALQLIREGDLFAAEETLKSIPPETADWCVAANLGRILESRHAPVRALESYETAAAAAIKLGDMDAASRIQFRMANCLKTLGRADESRRALEYALDLNSDNLKARIELSRMW